MSRFIYSLAFCLDSLSSIDKHVQCFAVDASNLRFTQAAKLTLNFLRSATLYAAFKILILVMSARACEIAQTYTCEYKKINKVVRQRNF